MNKSAVNSADEGPDPKRLEKNTLVHFLLFNKQCFDLLFKVQRGSPDFFRQFLYYKCRQPTYN